MASETYTLYRHVSPEGKTYIGITSRPLWVRWQKGGSAYRKNPYFAEDIRRFGWDSFKHESLKEGLTQEEAEALEVEYIEKGRTYEREHGYNIKIGTAYGGRFTEESKRKISEAQKGKPRPESHRIKSLEEREKLRRANLGNHNARGCHRTEEHKERLRELKSKGVCQYSMSGEKLGTFRSLAEAEKQTGISKGNICEMIHGKRTHAGGFLWAYA